MTHPTIEVPKLVEAIKAEVKKYIKRESNKTLPINVDYWDFDCRFGANEKKSEVIHVGDINKHISDATSNGQKSFYLEILAKQGRRNKKNTKELKAKAQSKDKKKYFKYNNKK